MPHDRLRAAVARLNPEQREAVETTEGPLLVLAGAGSGKTRVLTVRTARLLANGVYPEALLLVTFTNKAADEMRERVEALAGDAAEGVTVGTFHAFCLAVLREHAGLLGYPEGFTLADPGDVVAGLKQILRELRVGAATIRPYDLQARISLLANELVGPEEALARAETDLDELVGRAYAAYEGWKRRSRLLDFDDLLAAAADLLRRNADVRDALRERYRYVMVDEYQDTNVAQYELLQRLCGPAGNLCAVGDDDQAIYGWRGAKVEKILAFERDFPTAHVVKLETNYRSTPEILDAANKVVRNNATRFPKTLRAARPSGVPLSGFEAGDDAAEADHVAQEILRSVREEQAAWKDFAVLFRTSIQPRAFEAQFRARGVPYVLIGGMSFFDRKEVRDVLAYLRLAINPDDEAAFLRIVNRPARGVGKTSLDRALAIATEREWPVPRVFTLSASESGVPQGAHDAVGGLRRALATWAARDPGRDLGGAVAELVELVGYRAEVDKNYPDGPTRTARWQAVEQLIEMAENRGRKRGGTLKRFVEELALAGDNESKDDAVERDNVTLLTLHSAKGLEFRNVYLAGLEEGVLPHTRAVADGGVEEERRLCYVGLTRAQERLTLSWCKTRRRGGGEVLVQPSRFLYELKGVDPPEHWRAIDDPRIAAERAEATGGRRGAKRATKQRAAAKRPAAKRPAAKRSVKKR